MKETRNKSRIVIASVAKQSILLEKSTRHGSPRRLAPRDDGLIPRFLNKLTVTIFATCLAAMMVAPAYGEEPIGRLFTTSGERSNLEYLRKTKKNIPAKPEQPAEQESVMPRPAPVVLPDAINLQGYVKRNDGKEGTVWVNDKTLQEGTGNKEVAIGKLPENSNRIPIRITGNGRYVGLKAGQVYDPATNRVREARNHAAQGETGHIGDE